MVKEDEGATFVAYRCRFCDLRRERKTAVGRVLPWVGTILAMIIIGHPHDDLFS